MTDRQLTVAAIRAATDGNQSAFARALGYSSPSNVGKRLRGEVALTEVERRLYRALIAHPDLVRWLAEA